MFFYDTGQCILNREQRRSSPHLFSADVRDSLVDYFDNNCYDGAKKTADAIKNYKRAFLFLVSCPAEFNLHWIRMEDFEISAEKDVIMDGLSADECKAACTVRSECKASELFV